MKKIMRYCPILFLGCALGCQPARNIPAPAIEPTGIDKEPPRLEFSHELDEKIQFFNTLLREKWLSDDDKRIATSLRDTYQVLKDLSSLPPTEAHYLSAIHDLFRCVSSMDRRYFAVKKEPVEDYSRSMSFFMKKRAAILDSYISGDFQAVIDSCSELKRIFGPDSLTPDIGLLFSLSLANKGMLDQAITVGERVAKELEASPDIIHLKTGIAEWYMTQGQREKAVSVYEKLADTMDEKVISLQSLGGKIGAEENEVKETGPTSEQVQPQQTEEMSEGPFLEEVEKLLEENRFSEARDLLLAKEHKESPPLEAEAIHQALKRLEQAEEDYLEEKISKISMKGDMDRARGLLEEERYEEVISMVEAMETGEGDNREVSELKQFAIEKLINRERNRAAKIFLAAKQTQDPVKKEEYLRESLQILNVLVEKYPKSPLNDKLKSHIKIVKEALDKLKNSTSAGSEVNIHE